MFKKIPQAIWDLTEGDFPAFKGMMDPGLMDLDDSEYPLRPIRIIVNNCEKVH